ncbi:periplasmic component [Pseudomonas syringae pv. actinidiae]|uniref:Periplasmic component n=1 Tax=Pseudomonas syringae pv. actinidiae TaxID=103796 RepID=A0A2V0QSR8_PSESF|nr:periplasmic component [Pseudomonas syringae pv. actinidiae]
MACNTSGFHRKNLWLKGFSNALCAAISVSKGNRNGERAT